MYTEQQLREAYESICNLLGAFDNPVMRRKANGFTEFQQEAINIAQEQKLKLEVLLLDSTTEEEYINENECGNCNRDMGSRPELHECD